MNCMDSGAFGTVQFIPSPQERYPRLTSNYGVVTLPTPSYQPSHQLCCICNKNPRNYNNKHPGDYYPTCSPRCGNIFDSIQNPICLYCNNRPCGRKKNGKWYATCGIECGRKYKYVMQCSLPGCTRRIEFKYCLGKFIPMSCCSREHGNLLLR